LKQAMSGNGMLARLPGDLPPRGRGIVRIPSSLGSGSTADSRKRGPGESVHSSSDTASPDRDGLVEALLSGKTIVVTDARPGDRADRGILAALAAATTPSVVNFMATHGRGIISLAMDIGGDRRLGLSPSAGARIPCEGDMLPLTSIEATQCTGTGISASDRALTIRVAGQIASTPADVISPGHIFPALVGLGSGRIRSLPEEIQRFVKQHTGYDVVVWCDILDDAGEIASAARCRALAHDHDLPFVAITG
jgi:3,4-dihydroxy 2-butanone 4-phosphate synthase/GTP cyclohydrolase II